jgi:tetratricopeptide (TPR) repeat protein
MARTDWYRNAIWNADIEKTYREKLSRSRSSRPQYLTIQAGYLTKKYPNVALSLIDEYFDTGDDFHVPSALCIRADCYISLDRISDAVSTYKQALDWELSYPGLTTTAGIDLAKLVANQRLSNEYDYVLEILTTRFKPSDLQFPNLRYRWNGCNALIANDLGHTAEAQEFAERALQAAAQTESPFRYHRDVSVVRSASDDFARRLKRIARPSKLRSLFRLIIR